MKKIAAYFVLIMLIAACSNYKGDPFYNDKGDWDDSRVPFIKPYEAINLNGNLNWGMNMQTMSMIENVSKATIVDHKIFIYSDSTTVDHNGKKFSEAWFIIIPSDHKELYFDRHDKYLNCLDSLGVKREPKLFDIKVIAYYYGHNETMDWSALK